MVKKTILYLVRPAAGGIKAHVYSLINYFKDFYNLAVAWPAEQFADLPATDVNIYPLPMAGKLVPYVDGMAIYALYHILKREQASLVHIHGFKAGLVGRIAARPVGVPVILTVHNYLADDHFSGLPAAVYDFSERFLQTWTQQYITVSQALCTHLTERFRVKKNKITVIHNGIDPTSYMAAARDNHQWSCGREAVFDRGRKNYRRNKVDMNALRIGTLARLAPQKGIEYLLKAAALVITDYPGCKFYIAGDGPLYGELERLVDSLDLRGTVNFIGFCADPPAFLASLDIFVLPSVSEGLSIALLEALAAGCPVVATNVGGVPEIIEDGLNGLLVTPCNTEALAKGIKTLISNAVLRQQFAVKGRARVLNFFTREIMLQKTARLYRQVLETCRQGYKEGR